MDQATWINIILTILSIFIPVFATIYTTLYTVTNRVKNENREGHKPYLVLKKVEQITLDPYHYYLTLISRNVRQEHLDIDSFNVENYSLTEFSLSFLLQNIGYGVASNVRFYDLLTGKQIDGTQKSSENQNQQLFTTFDLAKDTEKHVQAKLYTKIDSEESMDHNRLLCVYKDLNDNTYDFIISINIKNTGHYDFFSYQRSSRSYKKWVKEQKKEYSMILKDYQEN